MKRTFKSMLNLMLVISMIMGMGSLPAVFAADDVIIVNENAENTQSEPDGNGKTPILAADLWKGKDSDTVVLLDPFVLHAYL